MTLSHQSYLSPFSWRYGSQAMRQIWSEHNKRLLWRRIWVAMAEAQAEFGLVTPDQAADLRAHMGAIDIERALAIESQIHHDVMAELRAYAEQCPTGGGVIHLGMTSMDVVDNADALRTRASLDLVLEKLRDLLVSFAGLMERWADTPIMAFTHIQPAEPSTLGYRLAQYGQDLLADHGNLARLREGLKAKGLRGAVGTSASFADLIGVEQLPDFEARLSQALGIGFFPAVTQTYPRKQDYEVACALAGLGASLYKFAFDLRVLQSPPVGELSEPFGSRQVGSSAMPFKRNPINAEKIDSLARWLAQFPRLAWDNAAHSLLERTLDDSANRRTALPEAFLIADELLKTAGRIVSGLRVDEAALGRTLANYGPFAASERVLMAAVKAGADRQELHERLRVHAMAAWKQVRAGRANDLPGRIASDPEILEYLAPEQILQLMQAGGHFGDAPQRARQVAGMILDALET
jgi:adenylosuccinate lyase